MNTLTKNPSRSMRSNSGSWLAPFERSWFSPFEQFFNNDFFDGRNRHRMGTVPSLNVTEEKDGYKVELAAPGLKKEDLNIDVEGNMVTISCNKEAETKKTEIARPDTSRNGTYAEFVAVRGYELAVAPANMPLAHAAAIPLASQTAWSGLFEQGNLDKNQKVLIHGASGGVGTFAVQFAKCAGAYVIATASTKNINLVKSLGADEVIDYTKEDFSEKVKDADMVFDTVGKDTQQKSWQVLRKGGILVSTVGTDEQQAKKNGVRTKSFMMISNGARLQAIAELIDKNIVHVIIDKEFPLDEAKAAQDHVKEGHAQGKTILKVSDNTIQF
jgi:NADPH:quinone reductase-like Zn-dependent oxidoreductase